MAQQEITVKWTSSPHQFGSAFVFSMFPEATIDDYPDYDAENLQATLSITPETIAVTTDFVNDQRTYYSEFRF